MRNILSSLLLLFSSSLLIQAGCSKSDDDTDTEVTPPANAEQYITWNIGSHKGYLASPSDTLWASNTYGPTVLFARTSTNSPHVYANFNGSIAGTFPAISVFVFADNKYFTAGAIKPQINVSSYGAIGSYITGTYSGTLKDSASNTTYTATGMFKLKRR
ncbi:MAG TPA: hypothetical protein VM368_00745 [Flavisolibacter sp.]|jgi:hypothetical protein|nr:hypothetical protein [Flavisolibacter sp.]